MTRGNQGDEGNKDAKLGKIRANKEQKRVVGTRIEEINSRRRKITRENQGDQGNKEDTKLGKIRAIKEQKTEVGPRIEENKQQKTKDITRENQEDEKGD